MHEAVKTVVQLQSDKLRDEAQAENADFINKLDNNTKRISKDQVKEQVKAQVSKILPKIEKTVNEQLEAEVLTRLSNESKTSHAVAANLSELELKKILIDKMESNKSIHRSDEQKNLYKALVDAYESDKLILDIYGETVSFKRRRDKEDKDEEPFTGSNRGSKRRRARKEPESTSAPKEKTSKTTSKSTEGSKSHQNSADESIVIQRRVKDLQLGVKSYQKKLNLTKSNTYRSDRIRREAYSAYSNSRRFTYQNKDKKNRLMRIDELHNFSDNTVNDVWTVLNDHLKGIQMKYLPQTICRQSDRDKVAAMIQAID
ncbi:hypothetical protein Tco_1063997 [Tanacetum coccineum]